MKSLIALIALSVLAGCSSAPKKVLMKNCDPLGDNYWNCEEVPQKDIQTKK
jgi:uncharacterized lipoprotein YajG